MLREIFHQIKEIPEYWIALKAALAVLAMGLPIYAGIRYFLYRRRLVISIWTTLNFVGAFILFAGLAFLLASPLASHLPSSAISAYLFFTCLAAAFGVVSLIDVFFVQHYLLHVKHVYISPPLHAVIKISNFFIAALLILRFVLHFNPLALIAIPTIATAALAFALQDTLKAFIAGIALGRLIRLGEWIVFQDKEGRVLDIGWARTTIETADGQRVFIPNPLLQTGVFLNYMSGIPANNHNLKVRASYDTEPELVKKALLESLKGAAGIVSTPPAFAVVIEYTDSGILYGLFYTIEDYRVRLKVQDDVATRVWHTFKREGISIPYPIREVHLQSSAEQAPKTRPKKSL